MGFHEVQPCTSTSDRVCERDIAAYVPQYFRNADGSTLPYDANVASGNHIIMTEADENRMCLTIATGDWFPSRVDYGNPDTVCGIPATKTIKQFPQPSFSRTWQVQTVFIAMVDGRGSSWNAR